MTKYFYSMRIYTIFYMLWKLSGYDPIGYDPKIAIESIESEFQMREKKQPKKIVHRRNRRIKNFSCVFVNTK